MYRHSAFISLILASNLALAGGQPEKTYLSDMHRSVWKVVNQDRSCRLEHEIAEFGRASFERLPGGSLRFVLYSNEDLKEDVSARMYELSPPWVHDTPRPGDLKFTAAAGRKIVVLEEENAEKLLAILANGRMAAFDLLKTNQLKTNQRITINPVRLYTPLRSFRVCSRKLHAIPPRGFLIKSAKRSGKYSHSKKTRHATGR